MADNAPKIIFDREPDLTEKALRIGCGAVVGIAAALLLSLHWWPSVTGFVLLIVVLAAACAHFALRYGDHFFHEALKWFRWL